MTNRNRTIKLSSRPSLLDRFLDWRWTPFVVWIGGTIVSWGFFIALAAWWFS